LARSHIKPVLLIKLDGFQMVISEMEVEMDYLRRTCDLFRFARLSVSPVKKVQ